MKTLCIAVFCLLLIGKVFSKSSKEQPITDRQLSLETIRKNFSSLREKNRVVQEEYSKRGINLDSLPVFSPIIDQMPPSKPITPLPLEEKVPLQNPNFGPPPINRIGFYLGPCFPHDNSYIQNSTDFLELEYSTGLNLRTTYQRSYEKIFWGLGVDTKFFSAEQMRLPGTGSNSVKGNHSLISPFFSMGYEFQISETFFITSEVDLGYSLSKRNLKGAFGNTGDSFDSSFYYGFMIGPVMNIGESYKGMIFYRIDGINETGNYSSHLISQIGFQVAVQY